MIKSSKRTKILTAMVLCSCSVLCVSQVWAQKIQDGVLYGGKGPEYVSNINSNNNVVEMNNAVNSGEVKGIYGGFSINIDDKSYVELEAGLSANGNHVTINGGNIIGGNTELKAYPIGGGLVKVYTFDTAVIGGYANYTSYNEVIINDGTIETDVYGGFMQVSNNKTIETTNNKVYINGGKITGENIAGVYINDKGKDNTNLVINNGVYITGGIIDAKNNNSNIYGAYANDYGSKLEKNEVVISGGTINASDDSRKYAFGIYGASADRKDSSANYNIVKISGGIINGAIYGAYAYASEDDELIGNTVKITGGKITGDIYAVHSRNGKGTVKDNGIEISGNADLAEAELHGYDSSRSINQIGQYLTATSYNGNIKSIDRFDVVNVVDNSNIVVDSIDLYSYDDNINNGIINIDQSKFTVGSLEYTDTLSVQKGSLIADDIYATEHISIINSYADVKWLGDGVGSIEVVNSDFNIGRLYNFDNLEINNDNNNIVSLGDVDGSSYYDNNSYKQRGPASINSDSKFAAQSIIGLKELNVDMSSIAWEKDGTVIDVAGKADFNGTTVSVNGKLAAAAGTEISNGDSMSFIKAGELTGIKAADIDDSKLYIGFAQEADVTLTDNGNSIDFVVSGMPQASDQTTIIGDSRTAAIAFANQGSDVLNEVLSNIDEEEYGIKTFALVHGNRSKYDVASDIKINGWSVLTGVGETKKVNDDLLSWGVFYENGSGNYRTYNNFNGNDLTGFGSSVYNGGGAMLRYDNNSGTYIQAGVRAGNLKNSLGDAVADGFGTVGGYSIDSFYYGALLGVGKIIQLNETDNIDLYGKYFYTHHDGESVNILGDDVNFDSVESNRVRLGARYNKTLSEKLSGYYGLAWDYEFSGDADTYIAGFDVDNESLKGSTAVIEAGLHYAPDNSPWSIDLGLQGYAGQREGFSGNVQATYTF